MKLFGLYSIRDIPRLKANHRLFAESNAMEYVEYAAGTFYEKWVLVEWLLESNPDETCLFIDAFSYFVSLEFDIDMQEPILIQEINGKVMDNFFVVRSCPDSRKAFSEVRRRSAHRFTSDNSFLFDVPLPTGTAKPYGFVMKSGRRFNLDLVYTDRGEYFRTCDLPVGIGHPDCSSSDSKSGPDPRTDILVARYGGQGWPCQLTTMAEILCAHRFVVHSPAASEILEVVNPGRPSAILTLSCSESGMPPPEYAAVSERNFRKYAEARDVTLYLYKGIPAEYEGLHSTWTKPYLVLRHLHSHERLAWIDGDVLLSKDFPLPEGDDVIVYNDPGSWLFNAGFITFRKSKRTFDYLRAVIARCETIDDRSSLYVNGSDQTQFIEEFQTFFPDQLSRSNLAANTPVVLNPIRPPGPGLWHFMGINPPSVRAVVMDYYEKNIIGTSAGLDSDRLKVVQTEATKSTKKNKYSVAANPKKSLETVQKSGPTFLGKSRVTIISNYDQLSQASVDESQTPVVFCVDRSFLPFCSVALASLLKRGGLSHPLVYVFATGLNADDVKSWEKLAAAHPCDLVLVGADHHDFETLPSSQHISNAAYIRLLVPLILKKYRQILYLDADTLVVNGIGGLLEARIDNVPVAALTDPLGARFCKLDAFRSGKCKYFNSGVMIINTLEWNRIGVSQRAIEIAADSNELARIQTFADQCLLNHIIGGRFKEIERKFNTLVFEPHNLSRVWSEKFPAPSMEDLRDISILHFAGGCKIWSPQSTLHDLWKLYTILGQGSPWLSDVVSQRHKP